MTGNQKLSEGQLKDVLIKAHELAALYDGSLREYVAAHPQEKNYGHLVIAKNTMDGALTKWLEPLIEEHGKAAAYGMADYVDTLLGRAIEKARDGKTTVKAILDAAQSQDPARIAATVADKSLSVGL